MLTNAKSNQEKVAFDKTDICINLSTTFEETMGKQFLNHVIGERSYRQSGMDFLKYSKEATS